MKDLPSNHICRWFLLDLFVISFVIKSYFSGSYILNDQNHEIKNLIKAIILKCFNNNLSKVFTQSPIFTCNILNNCKKFYHISVLHLKLYLSKINTLFALSRDYLGHKLYLLNDKKWSMEVYLLSLNVDLLIKLNTWNNFKFFIALSII